jgi:homogentisate 1,2-dioxygenase
VAHGLYAEKMSGTAFTAPRHENQQTWAYRILPAAAHENFYAEDADSYHTRMTTETHKLHHIPNQLRWNPFDFDEKVDWVHGLHLVAGSGDPTMKQGLGILLYAAGKDMGNEAFYSADGDFLSFLSTELSIFRLSSVASLYARMKLLLSPAAFDTV